MASNEWTSDSKGWMWMNSDGKILKSSWIEDKGEYYYLKNDGDIWPTMSGSKMIKECGG